MGKQTSKRIKGETMDDQVAKAIWEIMNPRGSWKAILSWAKSGDPDAMREVEHVRNAAAAAIAAVKAMRADGQADT